MTRRRFTTLRAALVIAAGFVVLRVLYRIVFGGGSGGGILIADLPRIPLAGPFEHIVLFGPVTTGGIVAAVLGALPFAVLVLALGLVTVVVDVRALLTRGAVRGPVRTFSRALVVAWGTFPALLESVRRVRVARDLRGERSPASLVVPVLEQTVERAIALGASMEVRGFAATRQAEPDCARPVRVGAAALGFDDRWVLSGVDLDLAPGTLTWITGATGAGKSTLLHALSGVFQHVAQGDQRGSIEVGGVDRATTPPRETAGFVGVVAQAVRLSFVASTVAEELGFALAMRRVAPVIVEARVAEVAERLGIRHLLAREVGALSAGEACLVAIGAAIVAHPVLLLVDEPLADLDASARDRVVTALDRLAHEAGVCVVVAEHEDDFGRVADARFDLADRAVERAPVLASRRAPDLSESPARVPVASAGESSAAIAEVRGVSVRHGARCVVDAVNLRLRAGQVVALTGPNGAGKSSLLHAIARPPVTGVVTVRGRDVRDTRRAARPGLVALVPESFDDLLFATTVADECRRADRRAPRSGGLGTAVRWAHLLGIDDLDAARDLMTRHPRDLSAGERLCLVIAIQLATRPAVLLVDEPTRGLDAAARRLVGDALAAAAADGTAVMFATHDREFAARYATRTLAMANARIAEEIPA